LPIIAYAIGG